MAAEIERKFLVYSLPDVDGAHSTRIYQGYLAIAANGTEVRVRQKNEKEYTQAVKSPGYIVRDEVEIALNSDQFSALWPCTEGARVMKVRYSIEHEGTAMELDVYGGALLGLVTAEAEFPNLSEALSFDPPSWVLCDVSEVEAFKNQSLATAGSSFFRNWYKGPHTDSPIKVPQLDTRHLLSPAMILDQ